MIPLQRFDFSVLDDPHFKEDAVREEIVAPLVRALEYEVSGPNRVVRGRRLEHPYLALGVRPAHHIAIVPDYLLFTDDKPAWVLDAKSPSESIDDPDHLAQAYSYAVHRDVRVNWYALCNGREFALYNADDMSPKPRLRFKLSEIASQWGEIHTTLFPGGKVAGRGRLDKDFGLHLQRVGTRKDTTLHFVGVPFKHFSIGIVEPGLYRFSRGTNIEEQRYLASFDFDDKTLASLLALFPKPDSRRIGEALRRGTAGTSVRITGDLGEVHIACQLGEQDENDKEHFLPLRVLSVARKTTMSKGPAPAPEWLGDGARIIRVGAFYESNKPGGFSVVRECDEEFAAMLEVMAVQYDVHASASGADEDVKVYFGQLDALGQTRLTRVLTPEELTVALMNIFWLDTRGHLKADEYNGMQFTYEAYEARIDRTTE